MAKTTKSSRSKSRRQAILDRRGAANKRRQQNKIVIGGLLIIVLGFAAFNYFNQPTAQPIPAARLENRPTKGPQDAPVTLTEFGDFGCSACQSWHRAGVLGEILTTFDGQVNLVWNDFPIIMPPFSRQAALAGQCAHDQNRFWEFHDVTFERQQYSALRDSDLRDYAIQVGLDMETFNQCFNSRQYTELIDLDLSAAQKLGLRGTPSFLVNDQPIIGADPDALVAAIRAALGSQP